MLKGTLIENPTVNLGSKGFRNKISRSLLASIQLKKGLKKFRKVNLSLVVEL
jgi:hypothetical protein